LIVCLAHGCKNSPKENIQAQLQERVDKQYHVGIVVAVIDSDGTRFYSCGQTSKEAGAASMNEQTIFPLASITKVFTTLLLAEGVVNGQFQLQDPTNQFLPTTVRLPSYAGTAITLEDLATHTSGLPSFGYVEGYTTETFFKELNQAKLSSPPGSHYEYSNIIGLLGDIETNIWHTPYPQLLKQKILGPLGMHHTQVVAFPTQQTTEVTGYNAVDLPGIPWAFPILEAAGALQSTAEDMAKFVSANMGLSPSPLYPAMQLAHQPIHSEGPPQVDLDFPGAETLKIGLGWNIDQEHDVIWKNGNFPNYTSFIGFNPKTKRGVVVFTNTGNVLYTDNLALHILNPKIPLFPLYREITVPQTTIDQYAGKYHLSDGTSYIFQSEENHLKVEHMTKAGSSGFFNIYPMSDHQFFGRVADATFTFSQAGGKMSLTLQEGGEKQSGIRIDPLLVQGKDYLHK
jgi:CubicO group peptidase (beta-lactamase class C family)